MKELHSESPLYTVKKGGNGQERLLRFEMTLNNFKVRHSVGNRMIYGDAVNGYYQVAICKNCDEKFKEDLVVTVMNAILAYDTGNASEPHPVRCSINDYCEDCREE